MQSIEPPTIQIPGTTTTTQLPYSSVHNRANRQVQHFLDKEDRYARSLVDINQEDEKYEDEQFA